MHINTAFELVSKGEPRPEESVDLVCLQCAGMWSSKHHTGTVAHTNYVGREHLVPNNESIAYFCPKGCVTAKMHASVLVDIHSSHNYTPRDEWICANLVMQKHYLTSELKDIEEELENYSDLQI